MELYELRRLVSRGEGLHTEFKHKAADPLKIMREVVALANTEGGLLIIGVSDDLQITGLKDAAEELFVLEQTIERHIKPKISYAVQTLAISPKKEVLIFEIPASTQKPVFLIYDRKRNLGKAYVRVADRSVQASKEMRQVLRANYRTGQRDFGFTYGPVEQLLMRMFGRYPVVTKKLLAQEALLSEEEAAAVLVRMTLAGVLDILPEEELDQFRPRQTE